MADDSRILVQIELDDGSVRQGFARIKNEGKSTFESIGETAAAVFAGQVLVKGFDRLKSAITETFSKAVESASQGDQAVQRLNNSLALAGRFSEGTSRTFQNLADKIQETTAVSDDTVLGLAALATTYTKTNEAALKLTKTSINLAAVTGQDVNTALTQLAGTLSGQSGRLLKLFPDLKQFSELQLKAGAAVDYFNSRFGGAAEREANTFAGRVTQLGNAFDDVLKELGKYVTQSPAVIATIQFLSTEFLKLAELLGEVRGKDPFAGILSSGAELLGVINSYVIRPVEVAIQIVNALVSAFTTGFRVINVAVSFFGDIILGTFDSVKKFGQGIYAVLTNNQELIKELNDNPFGKVDFSQTLAAYDGLVKGATDAYDAINTFGNTTPFSDGVDDGIARYQTALFNAAAATQQTFTNIKQSIRSSVVDISKVLQEGLLKAISAGVSNLGAQLAKGTFAFKDFANAILSIVGDVAIQIGNTLIGIGIGIEKLRASLTFLSGGFAIAAGIALVALGGALKALSGSGSQGATSGGVASGGGGGFVAVDGPANTPDVADTETRQTGVTVVIQGDVFDTRETGARIIDIINDQFNSTGARVLAV